MLSGIRDILIISTPEDTPRFNKLFGDGKQYGLNLSYKIQPKPEGLAQAFIIGEEFIGKESIALILGDNIFFGHGLVQLLSNSIKTVDKNNESVVFGYGVKNPNRYGVVEFDSNNKVLSVEEKPKTPKSNFAVVGLYYYPNDVVSVAKRITPSKRGELEITSINNYYLNEKRLKVNIMGRGYAWLDTGTHEAMNNASNFIKTIEDRQGLKIACIEEIAFNQGFINRKKLIQIAKNYKNEYGDYLINLMV